MLTPLEAAAVCGTAGCSVPIVISVGLGGVGVAFFERMTMTTPRMATIATTATATTMTITVVEPPPEEESPEEDGGVGGGGVGGGGIGVGGGAAVQLHELVHMAMATSRQLQSPCAGHCKPPAAAQA